MGLVSGLFLWRPGAPLSPGDGQAQLQAADLVPLVHVLNELFQVG